MIDGEHGEAILAQVAAHRMDAMMDGGDTMTVSLIANCYADALRKGETPKAIAWQLWASMPDDHEWDNGIRDKVTEAVDDFEDLQAA